jgi:hypothetical protein
VWLLFEKYSKSKNYFKHQCPYLICGVLYNSIAKFQGASLELQGYRKRAALHSTQHWASKDTTCCVFRCPQELQSGAIIFAPCNLQEMHITDSDYLNQEHESNASANLSFLNKITRHTLQRLASRQTVDFDHTTSSIQAQALDQFRTSGHEPRFPVEWPQHIGTLWKCGRKHCHLNYR